MTILKRFKPFLAVVGAFVALTIGPLSVFAFDDSMIGDTGNSGEITANYGTDVAMLIIGTDDVNASNVPTSVRNALEAMLLAYSEANGLAPTQTFYYCDALISSSFRGKRLRLYSTSSGPAIGGFVSTNATYNQRFYTTNYRNFKYLSMGIVDYDMVHLIQADPVLNEYLTILIPEPVPDTDPPVTLPNPTPAEAFQEGIVPVCDALIHSQSFLILLCAIIVASMLLFFVSSVL